MVSHSGEKPRKYRNSANELFHLKHSPGVCVWRHLIAPGGDERQDTFACLGFALSEEN